MFLMNPYKILYEHRNNPKLYNSNKIMAVILFINIIYICIRLYVYGIKKVLIPILTY